MQIHELNNYTGDLGNAAYLVVDDGADTGKLTVDRLLEGTSKQIKSLENNLSEVDTDLNGRIDNIIAGGAAPSAAEIIDARRGADGVNYSSLGAAVRSQVSDLNDDIEELETSTSYYIEGDEVAYSNDEPGTVWRYVNNAFEKSTAAAFALFHVSTYPAEPNKKYRVTGCFYAPQVPICVFANANGDIIGSSTIPSDFTPTYYRYLATIDITTPATCAYIYVNFINLSLFPTVKELDLVNSFEAGAAPVAATRLTPSTVENGAVWRYINGGYSKNTAAAFAYWHTDEYEVKGGQWYEITGSQITAVPVVIFFNSDGTAITHAGYDEVGYNAINNTLKVKTPINCVKIQVNVFNTVESYVLECEFRSSYYSRWSGKKWCAIGDSLTASNATSIKKYYDFIAQFTDIYVDNQGKGGTGYANPSVDGNFITRMANIPTDCDVYTIFGSFNDVQYGRDNNIAIGDATDSGTTTMCGYFNSALDALYARVPLANVGVIAPCPWASINRATTGANQTYGQNYVKALEEVCKRRCVPFLNLFDEAGFRPWDDDWKLLIYTHDNNSGVHPNEIGHEILSTKIRAFLEELLS